MTERLFKFFDVKEDVKKKENTQKTAETLCTRETLATLIEMGEDSEEEKSYRLSERKSRGATRSCNEIVLGDTNFENLKGLTYALFEKRSHSSPSDEQLEKMNTQNNSSIASLKRSDSLGEKWFINK